MIPHIVTARNNIWSLETKPHHLSNRFLSIYIDIVDRAPISAPGRTGFRDSSVVCVGM